MSASFTSSVISPSNSKIDDNLTKFSSSLVLLDQTKNRLTSFRELASFSCDSQLCSKGYLGADLTILFSKNNLESQGFIKGKNSLI